MDRKNLAKIKNLRHELHEHPELSMNEQKTKRRLMDFIEENTRLAVVDCGHWFYASRYVEGTKGIAFRADMDALPMEESIELPYGSKNPGIAHKCGHDGHCAALCGLALEIDGMPEVIRSVYLIFQHAEETGQGARECLKFFRERSITSIYAFHNWSGWPENSIVIRDGLCQCASAGLTIKFTGKPSHASTPDNGINPAFTIAKIISELEGFAQNKKIFFTVVNVKVGEKNFGISPGDGEISLTLRAEREEDMRVFRNAVVNLAERLGRENSLGVEFFSYDYFPETLSDSRCVKKIVNAAEALGLNVIEMPEPIRASEDFGFYTKQINGAIFYIGNGENYPAIHTAEYDFNDEILETAVNMFVKIFEE